MVSVFRAIHLGMATIKGIAGTRQYIPFTIYSVIEHL